MHSGRRYAVSLLHSGRSRDALSSFCSASVCLLVIADSLATCAHTHTHTHITDPHTYLITGMTCVHDVCHAYTHTHTYRHTHLAPNTLEARLLRMRLCVVPSCDKLCCPFEATAHPRRLSEGSLSSCDRPRWLSHTHGTLHTAAPTVPVTACVQCPVETYVETALIPTCPHQACTSACHTHTHTHTHTHQLNDRAHGLEKQLHQRARAPSCSVLMALPVCLSSATC